MTYQQTLDYLFLQLPMYQRTGAAAYKIDLENIIELCAAIGNPQNNFKSIHIAGTNGKGSTAHIIAAVLQARGLKVGVHTSPHYRNFRERIKINGTYISENAVIDFVEKNKTLFEKLQPSFFEMTVAMTFNYFAKEQVDIAIIEVGLGGRLDSTNILNPELSVITNIGYDHQQFLGDTLELIAGEKAGIIKKRTPVIIGETHPKTEKVFIEKATACNAPIFFADQNFEAKFLGNTSKGQLFQILKIGKIHFPKLALNLFGKYQSKNLITAIQSLEIFDQILKTSNNLEKESILLGMSQLKELTGMIGRWEILGKNPKIITDSAHNLDGLKTAMQELSQEKYEQLHIVLGSLKDKDFKTTLPLFPKEAIYYFAKPNIPRGLDAKILKEKATEFELKGQVFESIPVAFDAAKTAARGGDVVYVGGSIFVVAEII